MHGIFGISTREGDWVLPLSRCTRKTAAAERTPRRRWSDELAGVAASRDTGARRHARVTFDAFGPLASLDTSNWTRSPGLRLR